MRNVSEARKIIRTLEDRIAALESELAAVSIERRAGDFPGGGRWEIVRLGQRIPSENDRVVVRAKIKFPSPLLPEPIRFGERVRIWGHGMYKEWFDFGHRDFEAETWREAFDQASRSIAAEAEKLQAAIDARERALAAAEM